MINKNDSATTRVHWDSLTQDEQNLLLSVNALQKPEPGQQIEHSFHWLQAMGQPLDSQSQQLLNAHNPARYVPNYVGERKEAREAVQQFFEREDIDALLSEPPFSLRRNSARIWLDYVGERKE